MKDRHLGQAIIIMGVLTADHGSSTRLDGNSIHTIWNVTAIEKTP